MENKKPTDKIKSDNEITNSDSDSFDNPEVSPVVGKNNNGIAKSKQDSFSKDNAINNAKQESEPQIKVESTQIPKKPVKPPKLEDKPFDEFISNYFIPGLRSSIEEKGILVSDIKLIEGQRPVVGDNCWMVFCEISEQRRFWLCFNNEIITSDKTILLAESNSEPSIVESFLIDEKKTTLPLLISRVLQRLNGQKWIGVN